MPCVRARDARTRTFREQSLESLIGGRAAEIPAHILERDGKVVIEKTCPSTERLPILCLNPAFLRRIESLFPRRDFPQAQTTRTIMAIVDSPWPGAVLRSI